MSFAIGTSNMHDRSQSPRISHVSWGRLEIEGQGAFKDAKLYPGGAREWDWRETGTRHMPGIQAADVEELLEHGAEVVVLEGCARAPAGLPRDPRAAEAQGYPDHVLPTEDAVRLYNELAAKQKVGGLFHSTC